MAELQPRRSRQVSAATFSTLPPLGPSFDLDENLPLGPDSLRHGQLSNGMTYYVRYNGRPKERVSAFLAVRIGSVVEEEHERGVAHILEHLAFNATEKFSNHELIHFLESIGAPFGACQNAHTSLDETVYTFKVPLAREVGDTKGNVDKQH